ncbi:ribonucleoside-diphosphate reductase subunit alpha [Duganella vulcania]|uniref:Ribonucleoside-diphosphate reductase n=1 Tax=Duganella vulcania TaxID=2692166 RepID=A0A845GH56_9BURK|nr:ribonucleoside-diphosphate reductase subunit alpha [Duganella vulcania]MYM92735.1 ribonucleoside-diphosphate reductase subunit alpha [Duganella vulcania]
MHNEAKHFVNQSLVVKRNGAVVPFDREKVRAAVASAYLKDEHGIPWVPGKSSLSQHERDSVDRVTEAVVQLVVEQPASSVHIETIQDLVEMTLMRVGDHKVARAYVLYRAMHTDQRAPAGVAGAGPDAVTLADGNPVRRSEIEGLILEAGDGLPGFDHRPIVDRTMQLLFQGMSRQELDKAILLEARTLMEKDPIYDFATARLLLNTARSEVFGKSVSQHDAGTEYAAQFVAYLDRGVSACMLDPRVHGFDLAALASALRAERDLQFGYLGLQTLYDRYLLHIDGKRFELPQWLFMRVAMGLAFNEADPTGKAIEFYEVLSKFDFMCSTPTLFNAATLRPQLSSCFLTTISDDLEGIYDSIKQNALLAKFAGGLGNDWTPVRALGAHIKGTNGKSQGIVPFLKVANDTAVAVNQGGKRKGAVCAYLETWHLDIEEFLDLRKNVGDDRRRTHDMNTANWIPDLFMKRVSSQGMWTLFSPSEVPELHDLYGAQFERAYEAYEAKALAGDLRQFKQVPALELWRKMLTMLFETGHPWITFKDPCNIRSPQRHVGVVHSSNLCTEITLNTNKSETAVCNLGSVNLVAHIVNGAIDRVKLQRTVRVAMRMLDNVIDLNYYTVDQARDANLRHRPVGLGVMGFQDMLHELGIPYASHEAVQLADVSSEVVCYYAYLASTELAEERGAYASFVGSSWSNGILPLDTINLLKCERGPQFVEVDTASHANCDWEFLRGRIAAFGMRNSNCCAIAPTATISNIVGVSPSIEPSYQQLYVKSNMAGEFIECNRYLVKDLRAAGVWDDVMVADLKYFDGSVAKIERVPERIKAIYATSFEVGATWLIEAAARRQKWIDQAQSLNIYLAGASGKKLDEVYKLAWLRGLKTTYYLRTLAASSAEKSTSAPGALNAVNSSSVTTQGAPGASGNGAACFLRPGDPGFTDCEACQ